MHAKQREIAWYLPSNEDCRHKDADSIRRGIIRIAILLNEKLPADLVLIVLDHARLWQTIVLEGESDNITIINEKISPQLLTKAVTPCQITPGSVRAVRFNLDPPQGFHASCFEIITSLRERSSRTWVEARTAGTGKDTLLNESHYDRRSYVQGSLNECKGKIVADGNIKQTKYNKCLAEWTANGDDTEVRQMLRSLEGGSAIEVSVYRTGPGSTLVMLDITIEIEYAVVRKV